MTSFKVCETNIDRNWDNRHIIKYFLIKHANNEMNKYFLYILQYWTPIKAVVIEIPGKFLGEKKKSIGVNLKCAHVVNRIISPK